MPGPDDIHPDSFPAACAEIEALNAAGRWPEALAGGAVLFRQFRDEPRACAVLAQTLVALGQADEAEALLRDAQTRFPAEAWISVRLAEIATSRRDWQAALAHWQAIGLPDTADPAQLRAYACVVAGSGDLATALSLVTAPLRCAPDAPPVLLTWAELLVRLDHIDDAADLWPTLARGLTMENADFAALTGVLALRPDAARAAPMLAALMQEPDPGTPDWRPAVASVFAGMAPDDPNLARLQQAVREDPAMAAGLAPVKISGAIAACLSGISADSDTLADRVARAVADGRVEILPLLLETASQPARAAALRVALRLYLNRAYADPERFGSITPRAAWALLMVARVADADCLSYFAELARARFPLSREPNLARAEDLTALAAAAIDRPMPKAVPLRRRLRVAVCVSGRLPAVAGATGLVRALRLEAHDAIIFAHVWQQTGPGVLPGREAMMRRLPRLLGQAFAAAADEATAADEAGGLDALRGLYPALLQGRPSVQTVDAAQLRARFHTDHAVVQDDTGPGLAERSAVWKARYAARQAHQMAVQTGLSFDLVLHLRADAGLEADPAIDWVQIATAAQAQPVMFADATYQFHGIEGFTVGQVFGLGARGVMDVVADSFLLGDHAATGRTRNHALSPSTAVSRALALQLHLSGIAVQPLAELRCGMPPDLDPVIPTAALALLWQDIRSRKAAPPDNALVRAAMADVTGSVGI